VEGLGERLADVRTAIDQRFLAEAEDSVDAALRLVQSFAGVKSYCLEVLERLTELRSDVQLAYETAVAVLDFEDWVRGLRASLYTLAWSSDRASRDLAQRVDPSARAYYRPFKGEDLYSISRKFFGTPFYNREIAEKNGLTTFTLQGTELLVIPNGPRTAT
jgi:hypothetical protein